MCQSHLPQHQQQELLQGQQYAALWQGIRKNSEGSPDQCCKQATAQRRPAKAKRSERMLRIREAQVLAWVDHGSASKRCGDLNLNGIPDDVRREDLETPPPIFCPHFDLIPWLIQHRIPMDGHQEHFPA